MGRPSVDFLPARGNCVRFRALPPPSLPGLSRPSTRFGAPKGRKYSAQFIKALSCNTLRSRHQMLRRFLQRDRVDGRDKPGHDAISSPGNLPDYCPGAFFKKVGRGSQARVIGAFGFGAKSLLRAKNSLRLPCSAQKNSLLARAGNFAAIPSNPRPFPRIFSRKKGRFPPNSLRAGNFSLAQRPTPPPAAAPPPPAPPTRSGSPPFPPSSPRTAGPCGPW